MKITIHRGIDQIGGCITEISTAKARILIDLG
jgi:ribonuclease J